MSLDASAFNALAIYSIIGSATGTKPGIKLGQVPVPLNIDAYSWLTLTNPFAGVFGSFLGTLDGNGTANASLTIPPGTDPGLVGITLYHAYVTAQVFGQVQFASNAVQVDLVP